jgi:hypothetical protein
MKTDRIATWTRWLRAGDQAMADQVRSAVETLGLRRAAIVLRVPVETLRGWASDLGLATK